MKKTSLVRLLRTFTMEELKEFKKFTASPYFARGRNLIPFLDALKEFYPAFDQDEFTNENVFSKLFPAKKFDHKNSNDLIKTLSHELTKMCEEFLIHSNFRNDINSKNYYLLDKLREKKLYNEFEKKYTEALSHLEKTHGGSLNDFMDNYFLLITYNEYCVETKNPKSALETIASLDEIAALIALIRGYRGFEHKFVAAAYNLKSVHNFSEDLIKNLNSEKMLNDMKTNNDKYYPYVALNYMFYMISKYPEADEYYFEFKRLVYENLNLFGHVEKYILLSRLASYCLTVSPERYKDKFMMEEFEINEKSLSLCLYKWSDKDDFSPIRFINITLLAIDLEKLDWAENFINQYSCELSPNERENIRNYLFAHLNYERKDYESALHNILKIKFNFYHSKIEVKILLCKIYYDLDLPEQVLSVLEAMRQYLTNTKELSETFKIKNKNFVKFTKGLLKVKLSQCIINPDQLRNEIKNEKSLSSKDWLLERAGELKRIRK